MFLSLVRPDRISSPMTRIAAVMISALMRFPFAFRRYNASTSQGINKPLRERRLMNQHGRLAAAAPHRPIRFAPAAAHRTIEADGAIRLTCAAELGPYDPSLARLFRSAVDSQPGRVFLAERAAETWRKLSYEQARPKVDALAAALLSRGLSA